MSEEFAVWKRHFINQARGLIPHQNKFYKVREQKGSGGGSANIKLVTPTQQVVERAKSTLSDPPVVYDPVTGITNQPINGLVKTPQKRKRLNCNCNRKSKGKGKKKRKIEKKKKVIKKSNTKKSMKGGGEKKKSNKKTSQKKKWYENI
jgi:hypothetical protein